VGCAGWVVECRHVCASGAGTDAAACTSCTGTAREPAPVRDTAAAATGHARAGTRTTGTRTAGTFTTGACTTGACTTGASGAVPGTVWSALSGTTARGTSPRQQSRGAAAG